MPYAVCAKCTARSYVHSRAAAEPCPVCGTPLTPHDAKTENAETVEEPGDGTEASVFSARYLLPLATVTLALVTGGAGPAGAADATRPFRLTFDERTVGGRIRGTLDVRLPPSLVLDAGPTARTDEPSFTLSDGSGCEGHMSLSMRAETTNASTTRQLAISLPAIRTLMTLGRGKRAHGRWRLDELKLTHGKRDLYGIAPTHIAGHVYLQIRALSWFVASSCPDATVRTGAIPATVERILREGKLEAKLTAR